MVNLTTPQRETLAVMSQRPRRQFTAMAMAQARGWYPAAASNVARTLDRLVDMGLAHTAWDAQGRRRWQISRQGLSLMGGRS